MDIKKIIIENAYEFEKDRFIIGLGNIDQIIAEINQALQLLQTGVIESVCEINKEFEGCPLFKQYSNGCYGCKYRKQTVL